MGVDARGFPGGLRRLDPTFAYVKPPSSWPLPRAECLTLAPNKYVFSKHKIIFLHRYIYRVCVCVCVCVCTQLLSPVWLFVTHGVVAHRASQVVLLLKYLLANAGDIWDIGLIPRSGRSPGEENSKPLQYSCLETPMDRGAWRAIVHSIAKSQTRVKWLSVQAQTVACQAPVSLGLPRQEYWSGLPFPTPEDLPDLGIESVSLMSPALAAFFTTEPPGKP